MRFGKFMYKWVFFFSSWLCHFLFVWAVVVPVIMVDTGFLIVLFFLGGCDGFSQLVEVVIC